ncbi:GNAT family N-acetyltransferase [Mesorhizobium sp. L-2-11]|uniref:GNAT family N-acetyltransferase n=1 Tax=Mesorhizobium sp. L-2-11 TaxID=2744521 RepID=UPI0018EA5BF3|nr:GNAT family N-acetyltransferase [Mesorhizobium sp. L-2-11]
MKIAKPCHVSLRRATGEDEPFILELERSALRRLSEAIFGYWTPRPGMGETFPDGSWIIQRENEDVGCFALSERQNVLEIEQLYLLPDARNCGIGNYVLTRILTLAAVKHHSVQIVLLAENDAQRFLERAGFAVTAVSSTRIFMECLCSREPHTWTN